MSTSETPLSDLMDLVVDDERDPRRFQQFLSAFRRSRLGVRATGAPPGTTGDFWSSKENPVAVGTSTDPEGRPVLLAIADPPAFIQRYGLQFNADMPGEALLETVLINPDTHGIRVNSAKREISLMIYRDVIEQLKRGPGAQTPERRPWWKLW